MASVLDATWNPSTDSHDGERVYRATGPSPTFPDDYTEIADIGAGSGSYADSNAPNDSQVWYAVTAYNADGESDAATNDIQTSAVAVSESVSLTSSLGSSLSESSTSNESSSQQTLLTFSTTPSASASDTSQITFTVFVSTTESDGTSVTVSESASTSASFSTNTPTGVTVPEGYQFFTDFSNASVGSGLPTDWGPTWLSEDNWEVASGGNIGGNYVRFLGDNFFAVMSWERLHNVSGDVEIVALIRGVEDLSKVGLYIHGDEFPPGARGVDRNQGYVYASPMRAFSDISTIGKFNDSSSAEWDNNNAVDPAPDTWRWVRFKRQGDELYGRSWDYGSDEPTSWGITRTDSSFDGGFPGIGSQHTAEFHVDAVGIGLGGVEAPMDSVTMPDLPSGPSDLGGEFQS